MIDNFSSAATTASANPTTNPATGETLTGATVNATNGDYDASNTGFWWGTTSAGPFNACTSCGSQLPSGWTHDAGLGAKTAGSSFNEALTGLTPGTQYYFVAWSEVGGTWYPGDVLTFTTVSPDTTAPAVPTLVSPANGVYRHTSNSNKSDWTDVTDPSTPVVYYYESSLSNATNPNGSFTSTAYQSSALTDSEIMNPGEPEVTYYWHVKACDSLDNCSNWSPAWQIHIDNTVPTIPGQIGWSTENPPVGSNYITGIDFNDYKTCGQSVNYSPMTNLWAPSTDANGVAGYDREVYSPNDSTLIYSSSLSTNYANGGGAVNGSSYWVRVRAYDAAGNKSNWTSKCSITYDTTVPTAPTITAPNDGQFFTSTPITAHWSAVTDSSSGIAKYQVGYVYDDHHLFSGSTCSDLPNGGCRDVAGNVTSRNHVPSISEQGGVTIYVRAVDGAGNVGPWSAPVHYTYDETDPTTPVANPPAGDYSSDQSVTLTSSDTGGSGIADIYYTIDGSVPNNTKTLYSSPIDIGIDLTLKAIAYDNAGNTSGILSATYGIPPIISDEASSSVSLTSATITWTTDDLSTSRVVYGTLSVSDLTVDTFADGSNYGYTDSTVEDPTKVTSHSVGLSGLTAGTTYYYRTISHGSPEARSSEQSFTTSSPMVFAASGGGPGDGLSDGKSDGKSDGGSSGGGGGVLGASTVRSLESFPEVQVQEEEQEGQVLGTESANPEFVSPSEEAQTPETNYISAAFTSRAGMLLVFLFVVGIIYFLYRRFRKRTV